MQKDVLDLVTEALSVARLDEVVINTEEYDRIVSGLEEQFDRLSAGATQEQRKELEAYRAMMFEYSDLYRRAAYRLGMADMKELLTAKVQ